MPAATIYAAKAVFTITKMAFNEVECVIVQQVQAS